MLLPASGQNTCFTDSIELAGSRVSEANSCTDGM
jgi:hypothetical protein